MHFRSKGIAIISGNTCWSAYICLNQWLFTKTLSSTYFYSIQNAMLIFCLLLPFFCNQIPIDGIKLTSGWSWVSRTRLDSVNGMGLLSSGVTSASYCHDADFMLILTIGDTNFSLTWLIKVNWINHLVLLQDACLVLYFSLCGHQADRFRTCFTECPPITEINIACLPEVPEHLKMDYLGKLLLWF